MADFYFQNLCQPEADIKSYLLSMPAVIDNGKSAVITNLVGTEQTISITDLATSAVTTVAQTLPLQTCTIGTQAMSVTGISNDDKNTITWGLVLVLITAWSIHALRRAL